MEKISQTTDMQELALVLMNLPEKARERICYMIEGALLVQEPSPSELTAHRRQTAPRSTTYQRKGR